MKQPSTIVGYVYLITNLVNGKAYVGCTKASVEGRWKQHLKDAKKGRSYAIYAALRKYGASSFSIETLEVVVGAHSDLMAAEIRQIEAHNCIAPKGYNLTKGGEGVDLSAPGAHERLMVGVQRRSANQTWLKNTREAGRRRSEDVAWRQANLEGSQRRWAGWQPPEAPKPTPRREAAQKRSVRSDYREKNLAALPKAWAAHSAKAVARDAHLSPEEQAKRAHRRERDRVNAARAYARTKTSTVSQEL